MRPGERPEGKKGKEVRRFDYSFLTERLWDTEIVNYIGLIHEYKGKQELYVRQNPAGFQKLAAAAKIQSAEASNRIEGIVTGAGRMRALAQGKTPPGNREEEEILGYWDVLKRVHEKYEDIPVRSDSILQLHRDLMQYTGSSLGGSYKVTQNCIQETGPDGRAFLRFMPVPPQETEPCMHAICESYQRVIGEQRTNPLLVIPVFLADFLCIHPFHDGNGRMSRLLTLLMLYRTGYQVGRYISIEKHIEKTKEAYYDALELASQGWHEGEGNPKPFIKYMLGVILACYREFEARVEVLNKPDENGKVLVKSSALDIVRAAVESRIGKFTKTEILNICPTISRSSVEAGLRELIVQGEIRRFGTGRSTFYIRSDAIQ